MDRKNLFAGKLPLVIFSVLTLAGIIVTMESASGRKALIPLASSVSDDTNQHSAATDIPATKNNTAPAAFQQVNPSVSTVTQAAVKMGVLSSVSRINQVAGFLTANNQSGVFIFTPQNPPDRHIFSTSFELLRPDDSTIYASASFCPNQDAVYDTVEYVNKSCDEAEKTIFKNLKRVGAIKKNIILLDGGTVKVFLMPAGSGCVVIKKEVVQ
jgi:hypothetical protein